VGRSPAKIARQTRPPHRRPPPGRGPRGVTNGLHPRGEIARSVPRRGFYHHSPATENANRTGRTRSPPNFPKEGPVSAPCKAVCRPSALKAARTCANHGFPDAGLATVQRPRSPPRCQRDVRDVFRGLAGNATPEMTTPGAVAVCSGVVGAGRDITDVPHLVNYPSHLLAPLEVHCIRSLSPLFSPFLPQVRIALLAPTVAVGFQMQARPRDAGRKRLALMEFTKRCRRPGLRGVRVFQNSTGFMGAVRARYRTVELEDERKPPGVRGEGERVGPGPRGSPLLVEGRSTMIQRPPPPAGPCDVVRATGMPSPRTSTLGPACWMLALW